LLWGLRYSTVLFKIRRACLTAIGVVALAVAACGLASRYLPITNHAVLFVAAASPYLMLCAPVAVILLIWGRHWVLAIGAAGLTVAAVAVQLPLYLGSDANRIAGVEVRVMSANIYEGRADANDLVRSARAKADVVAVQELTPRTVDRLSAAGLDATFPYRYLDARGASTGVGMWSRYPIQAPRRIDGYTMAFLSAQVRVTGVTTNPTIVVAHIPGPWPYPIDNWRRDLDRLPTTLREIAERANRGAVILAADVNSTTDMRPFRALLHDGYRDAAEQSGAGIKPTFPADTQLPPLVAIDHILTRDCAARSLHTLAIPGSDHRGLVVTVTVPETSANP
jgi:endonuclease/exonuclease/phosphatase (EEP) superfamily protein YafD